MRRISFDYPNTCPAIDKAINEAKANIESFLDELLDEACPLLPLKARKDLASGYADRLYADLEDAFEQTRSTNEDMRREAERQIESLHSELDEAQAQVADLEQRAEQ